MARKEIVTCDKCGTNGARAHTFIAILYTDEKGITLSVMDRKIIAHTMDLCDECESWIHRENVTGRIPARVKWECHPNDEKALHAVVRFDDTLCESAGGAPVPSVTDEGVPTAERVISQSNARTLPERYGRPVDTARDMKQSATLTIKSHAGLTAATITQTYLGKSYVTPHIEGKKVTNLERGILFDSIVSDEERAVFMQGIVPVFMIRTNLRTGGKDV